MGGLYLIAEAAGRRPSPFLERRVDATVRAGVTPLLFGVLGLGILVYGRLERVNGLAVALAAALLVGVMARLVLAFREKASARAWALDSRTASESWTAARTSRKFSVVR